MNKNFGDLGFLRIDIEVAEQRLAMMLADRNEQLIQYMREAMKKLLDDGSLNEYIYQEAGKMLRSIVTAKLFSSHDTGRIGLQVWEEFEPVISARISELLKASGG